MWGLFRQEEPEPSDVSPKSMVEHQERKGGTKKGSGKQRLGFGRNKGKRAQDDVGEDPPEGLNISVSDEAMNVAETHSGIEVSLDWKAAEKSMLDKIDESSKSNGSKSNGDAGPSLPVVSLSHQLRQCRRVHRSQFSTDFPALDRFSCFPDDSPSESHRRNHRVPILDVPPTFQQSVDDILALLESHEPQDEATAVRNELQNLKAELEAIEDDRSELDNTFLQLPATPEKKSEQDFGVPKWDIHYLLGARKDLTPVEKAQLQQNRGLCLTLHMQNPRAREAFLSKCGYKVGPPQRHHTKEPAGASVSLGPNNCRHGGAGATLRHISLMNGGESGSSFFVGRDNGKSFTWGPLPPSLYRRMKDAGLTPQNGDGGLLYLSTGPRGCYYCQFQSGECWWGNALKDDQDFESIVNDWDVYRVAFGPIVNYVDENETTITINSWIILGRDGRVAWKNLPSRLHNRLYGRLADWSAPVSVSLGCGDSYFIRFLDGSVDYCLPSAVASVCEHIEQHGGIITDMVLHPEVSQDYVIRHTEIPT